MGVLVPLPPSKIDGLIFKMDELWVCPYCRSLMVFSRTECRNCGAPYLPSEDTAKKVQEHFDRYFGLKRSRFLRKKANSRP